MGKVKQPTKVINALKFGEFSFSSPSEISDAINNDFFGTITCERNSTVKFGL